MRVFGSRLGGEGGLHVIFVLCVLFHVLCVPRAATIVNVCVHAPLFSELRAVEAVSILRQRNERARRKDEFKQSIIIQLFVFFFFLLLPKARN